MRTGRRIPVRQATEDRFEAFSEEDLAPYVGKWIVAYRGGVQGVGDTLDEAWRRARPPEGVVPFVYWVPPPDLLVL